MGAACHHHDDIPLQQAGFRRILWAVIAINGIMFAVEMTAGFSAGSLALQGDALDFAGDTATYAISLAVLSASLAVRARTALVKGISMALLGLWILGTAVARAISGDVPDATTVSVVGFLALAANLLSVVLLMRFRSGDANLRSVWLCSRNDAIGNVAVILAGAGIFASASRWPDLIVAAVMAGLFLRGAVSIIVQARQELVSTRATSQPSPGA